MKQDLMYPKVYSVKKKKKSINRVKKTPLAALKRKTWKEFSKWIRLRDCLETTGLPTHGLCFTCDKLYPFGQLQAGHFKHGSSKASYYDKHNVHAQCVRCNKWLSGNGTVYAIRLAKKYGLEEVERLEALSHKQLLANRDFYENLLKELNEKTN